MELNFSLVMRFYELLLNLLLAPFHRHEYSSASCHFYLSSVNLKLFLLYLFEVRGGGGSRIIFYTKYLVYSSKFFTFLTSSAEADFIKLEQILVFST